MGLVYARAAHGASLARWRTRRIEDNGRLENESRDIEDGKLLNNGMKDDRITVTGDDLRDST